ncbi:Uncharacterised protein [Streptococcus constellatus]|uniref:PIN like domain-containing protein n=1 Tax=Streptococcus constellatus TaxID=76860 RepID=A0A564STA1_STRCV|nr:PIN-like domain-containing protein [Streptococcus constellatus]VUW91735.1 Uncharacterised protein [Streptococcus gordonii]VUW98271.1 Uncharacterised protein [Streptococcus constellatus]
MNWNEINELYKTDDDEMYHNAILIFDTSSLLELYFYSTDSAIEILEKCNYHFNGKIFLPNHVKFEYDKNREVIIKKQKIGYQNVFNGKESIGFFAKIIYQQEKLKKMRIETENAIKNFEQQFGNRQTHPYFSSTFIEEFKKEVNNFTLNLTGLENSKIFSDFENRLKTEKDERIAEITEQIEQDDLKNFIETHFEIGDSYSFSEMLEIMREGELRYSASVPPGYMDEEEKQSFQIYGDLIIWKQILEYAKSKSSPVIFVSDDTKEDWNEILVDQESNKKKKKTDPKRPRYEILLEFNDIVGKKIKKLKLSDFLYEFNEQLKTKFGSSTLSEIKYKSLKETIEDEALDFIRFLEREIEVIQSNGLKPDHAYEFDEIDNAVNLLSIDEIRLNTIDEYSYHIEYLATFDCNLEYEYFEYWGRDDDTREAITSPASNISASGELLVKIEREIEVEFGEDFYPSIKDEGEPQIEIIEDNRDINESSWEDSFFDEDDYDYY